MSAARPLTQDRRGCLVAWRSIPLGVTARSAKGVG
jgi:hypothetical protein